MRVHPALVKIKEEVLSKTKTKSNIYANYVTSKLNGMIIPEGKEDISGGIATNIGIHFNADLDVWFCAKVTCF
ncbi:MAG: hypothetical protein MZV64_67775 [Ignavibacteriales bacterium]|nr:hypothetical protein [Ignavibacteriales bacterium]